MKDNAVILAVLLIISASIGPAWNLTIAELADATDTSASSAPLLAFYDKLFPLVPDKGIDTTQDNG